MIMVGEFSPTIFFIYKKLLCIAWVLILLITQNLNAQNFDWAKSMGTTNNEYGTFIATDKIGNTYSLGDFTENNRPVKYLIKKDRSGNLIWLRKVECRSIISCNAHSILLDGKNSFYFIGSISDTNSILSFTTNDSLYVKNSIFIAKYDTNGTFISVKNISNGRMRSSSQTKNNKNEMQKLRSKF
jgi:hypothetical protein